jgi:hypothetical protein
MEVEIEPEITERPEAGPCWVGLWALARHWVELCASMFAPQTVASPGLSRRLALRCGKWLWSIESLVRRLIVAAALAFDVATLPALKVRAGASASRHGAPTVAGFIVLSWPHRMRPQPHPAMVRPPKTPAGHRHLGFPGEDLLRLGRRELKHTRASSRRLPHPLHRRGGMSPSDPDYCEDPVKAEADYLRYVLFGPYRPDPGHDRLPERRERRHADRSSPFYFPRDSDVPEWKRLEQEWARVIPAPRLAARITALVRLMEKPERAIARLARRLRQQGDLIGRIHELPPPRFRKSSLDHGPAPPLLEPLAEAHARMQPPDTS